MNVHDDNQVSDLPRKPANSQDYSCTRSLLCVLVALVDHDDYDELVESVAAVAARSHAINGDGRWGR